MATELTIPSAGESITEVMVVEWRVNEGGYVEQDAPVVEIETDKASMEVPAPVSGTLTKQLKAAGDTANVGEVIATFEPGEKPAETGKQRKQGNGRERASAGKPAAEKQQAAGTSGGAPPAAETQTATAPAHVMPAAQRLLDEHQLSAGDVRATGPGGRLLKEDVLRHIEAGNGEPSQAAGAVPATRPMPAASARGEEVVPMSMLRRRIAERLVEAQQQAALLTTFNEVDMSAVMGLRKKLQDQFTSKYGIKLGFMSFFVKASIDALQEYPAVNAEVRGTDIVYKNYYDIGVAVGTDKGLVVPIVRHAERLSFAEVEQTIADLATRARDRKLAVEELQGGTFTISNGGVYGSMLSTPIVNPPQVGILGLHNIQQRPIAHDNQVVIRPMMYLALTYDHRIIDGKEAVSFLRRVKECIEDPTRMLVEA